MIRLLALVALAAAVVHAETPADYAFGMPLSTTGSGALHRLQLPEAIYEGATRTDLGDLRVYNADGAPVPFAWVPRPEPVPGKRRPVALPLFPLLVDPDRRDVEGLTLDVVRDAAGTSIRVAAGEGRPNRARRLCGYIVDVPAQDEPLAALVVALRPEAGADALRLRIDASDDLATWRTVVADATLVDLEYGGRRLTRDRIELAPAKAKYLRLSWAAGRPGVEFASVTGEFGGQIVDAPRQWRRVPAAVAAERDGEYEYDLGGAFPVDRIALDLGEAKSVGPAQILVRDAPRDAWQAAATTVFYRLQQPGDEVTSAPLEVAGDARRHWLLRVDRRAGGFASGVPALRFGWQPRERVFAARGRAPFLLAYGSGAAPPGALPIATLVPGYDAANGLPPGVPAAQPGAQMPAGGPDRLRAPFDAKRWWLWASLALGAMMLGWMAWCLSRDIGSMARSDTESGAD